MVQIVNPLTIVNTGGGRIDIGIPREISQSGVYQMPSSSFTYTVPTGVTDLGDSALYYAFRGCTSLTSVDLSGLTDISNSYGAYFTFVDCTSLVSADLSGLVNISGANGLSGTFRGCISLTSVGDSSASVDLSSLETATSASALSSCFFGCTGITTATFPSLTTINGVSGSYTLSQTFRNCTNLVSVSFPALTTITAPIALDSCFSNMLLGCSNVTVHFPAAMQSVISVSSFQIAAGGTNITVLFDL